MIKCENCGKRIVHIITRRFNYDGSDSEISYTLRENAACAVVIDTDTNWCGYGLNEEDQRDSIKCPYCGKFPFKHKEIQVYDTVSVVMFKQIDNG